jgi:hypothetical protein
MSDQLATFSRGYVGWSVRRYGGRVLKVNLPDTALLFQIIKGHNSPTGGILLRCKWAETEYELRFDDTESTIDSVQGELTAKVNGGYRHFARIDEIAQFCRSAVGNLDNRIPFSTWWVQYPQDPDHCAYGWEHAISWWRYPFLRVVHSHFIKPTERTARTLVTMRYQLLMCPRIKFDGSKIRVPKLIA